MFTWKNHRISWRRWWWTTANCRKLRSATTTRMFPTIGCVVWAQVMCCCRSEAYQPKAFLCQCKNWLVFYCCHQYSILVSDYKSSSTLLIASLIWHLWHLSYWLPSWIIIGFNHIQISVELFEGVGYIFIFIWFNLIDMKWPYCVIHDEFYG